MTNWQKNPRYQRAMQKLQRMSPDQRAIVDAAMLDESFGDLEARKMLQSMRAGTSKKQTKQRLDLARRTQATNYELGKEQIGLGKERLGLSRQRLESDSRHSTAMQGLRRKTFEYDKKQIPISTALGVANVGLSGYTGYQEGQRKKRMADIYADIARQHYGGGN